jgi:Cu(I)/Ag(I) efflux system membrane fusion protein
MNPITTAARFENERAHLKVFSCLIMVWLALSVLSGCDSASPSPAETSSVSSEIKTGWFIRPATTATLVHQADGPELMVIANAHAEEGPIDTVRQAPLPAVLEATGQVTFDDKLVSTISSRLTGRIEEMRTSQWEMVRRGQLVMKIYSPDYMSAEAEYLAATSSGPQNGSPGTQPEGFGMPAAVSMGASLKEAAVRKLDLLGFSPAEIAAIRTPSPSVWVRAPISGIIVSKNVVRGQAINPGDQLLALATLQRVWITADIYQDDLSRVWVGQSLEAVTASYPGEVFKGTVQKISPALDPNIHTLQLRCQVNNPRSLLKPQMLARVRLVTSPGFALVVPQSALVFDDNGYFAFIVTGADRVERRRVEITEWNEPRYARVLSGFKPGDRFLKTESVKFNAMWHAAHSKTS